MPSDVAIGPALIRNDPIPAPCEIESSMEDGAATTAFYAKGGTGHA
jgi:hypothetical protein